MSDHLLVEKPRFRKALISLLFATLFLSGVATVFHWSTPHTWIVNLIIPPAAFVCAGILLSMVYFFPDKTSLVAKLYVVLMGCALTIPCWIVVFEASHDPSLKLINLYPPITSFLLIATAIILMTFRHRVAVAISSVFWLINAAPVLTYLMLHRDELWAPRGQDMFIAFGPLFVFVIIALPFVRSYSNSMNQLQKQLIATSAIAERDSLTRLLNRHGIENLIATQKGHFSLLLIDVDHFKNINDRFGHQTGDAVLCEIARRLTQILRKEAHVSRWGGEEFLVLLENIREPDLKAVAERVLRAIENEPFPEVGKVTASIGGATHYHHESGAQVFKRTDQALYQAKANGRNQVVYADMRTVSAS